MSRDEKTRAGFVPLTDEEADQMVGGAPAVPDISETGPQPQIPEPPGPDASDCFSLPKFFKGCQSAGGI